MNNGRPSKKPARRDPQSDSGNGRAVGECNPESPEARHPLKSFPGKVECAACHLPVSPESLTPKGFCLMCANEMDMARNVAALLSPDSAVVPPSGFSAALAEVKRNGRPMTIDFAEILSRKLGGVEGIGERLVEDLKKLRGEHLPPDMQQFHEPDFKVVKGFYEIITKAMASRDTMVGEHGDPLDGVSEEDLMLIAAQAAFVRIPEDADFRRQLIDMIVEVDPELVLEAAAVALDKVPVRGTVEVLDAT